MTERRRSLVDYLYEEPLPARRTELHTARERVNGVVRALQALWRGRPVEVLQDECASEARPRGSYRVNATGSALRQTIAEALEVVPRWRMRN